VGNDLSLKEGGGVFSRVGDYHEIMVIIIPVRYHAEDMVAMSPLTANVCISHHETFRFKCKSVCLNNLSSYFQSCPWEFGSV